MWRSRITRAVFSAWAASSASYVEMTLAARKTTVEVVQKLKNSVPAQAWTANDVFGAGFVIPNLVRIRAALSRCLSLFVRNRNAFLFLVIASVVVKFVVSALVPASSDLVDILKLAIANDSRTQWAPWIVLNKQIIDLWATMPFVTSKPEVWWQTPPMAMPMDLRLLAVLVRLPVLLCDLAIAFVLYFTVLRVKGSTELARLATLAWLVNPYALFAIEMLSMPDVAVSMLVAVGVLMLLQGRTKLASLAFAGGIALKLYPIFLLPCVLLYEERNKVRTRLQWFTFCLAFLGLSAYLSWNLKGSLSLIPLIQYSPISQPIGALFEIAKVSTAIPQIPISYFTAVLVVVYFVIWHFGKTHEPSLVSLIVPILLFYYAFTDPYPQYLVWVLPFLTLDLVLFGRRHLALLGILLTLAFGWGFTTFAAYSTPSGYSLLLFPTVGGVEPLPWYVQSMFSTLFSREVSVLVTPWLRASLSATSLVYSIAIFRLWVRREPNDDSSKP